MSTKAYKNCFRYFKNFLIRLVVILLAAFSNQAAAVQHYESMAAASSNESGITIPEAEPQRTEGTRLPIILNDSVEAYIEHFTSEKQTFQAGLNNSTPYLPLMKQIFREEKLPEELVYVVMIESSFDAAAVSRANAVGLWQFMAGTAREYGLTNDEWVDERRDHLKSTRAAARYLKALHAQLRSWTLALAAYNAGTGRVRQAIFRTGSEDFWDLKRSTYLGTETKNFIPKIMAAAIIGRDPAAYGFRVAAHEPPRFDIVEIRKSTDLEVVAKIINSTLAVIKSLNPEIKGRFTPARSYLLKIPEGKRKIFVAEFSAYEKAGNATRLTDPEASARGLRGDRSEIISASRIPDPNPPPAGDVDKPSPKNYFPNLFFARTGKPRKTSVRKNLHRSNQHVGLIFKNV